MIFTLAALVGLVAGMIRAKMKANTYFPIELKYSWMILLAFVPQWLVFLLPATRELVPNTWIPFILISTQLILLVFVWLNRRQPCIWLLGLGLMFNFFAICSNNGWMPISPDVLQRLQVPQSAWQLWERRGFSKDMVIPVENTKLWILSDILSLNLYSRFKIAFSIGDILIAGGIFAYFWSSGGSKTLTKEYQS